MHLFFFLIIDLYFLVPTVIPKIVNPTAEHAIPTKTATSKANAEIKTSNF